MVRQSSDFARQIKRSDDHGEKAIATKNRAHQPLPLPATVSNEKRPLEKIEQAPQNRSALDQ